MAIARNAASGSYIDRKGEYRAKVTEAKSGMSKTGKRMLTVTFMTTDERSIKSFFVQELIFHMKSLTALKIAAGLTERDTADRLVGREVGILVEPQKPNQEGRVFMHVVGYGPASDVTENSYGEGPPDDFMPPPPGDDEVPF